MTEPIYTDDWVTLYHGDCLEVLPQLGTVDHVITDPPYDDRTAAGVRTSLTAKDSPIDFGSIIAADIGPAMIGASRRWSIAFCALEQLGAYQAAAGDAWVRAGVWTKSNPAPQFTGDRPGQAAEGIAIMHPKGKKRWNGGGSKAHWHSSRYTGPTLGHPTIKPLSLMRELVTLFTDEGETVLDPFAGSGTTGRACKDLGRRCILIEREEKYCDVIIKRMAQERLL